jgi:hypothetical protein
MTEWIKNNRLLAGAIGLLFAYVAYTEFLSGPQNYNDCRLDVALNAKTDNAIFVGLGACKQKFKK